MIAFCFLICFVMEKRTKISVSAPMITFDEPMCVKAAIVFDNGRFFDISSMRN